MTTEGFQGRDSHETTRRWQYRPSARHSGVGRPQLGEQVPTPRGELRIVDTDPMNWAWIAWNVFEHLIEFDKDGTLVPRLATTWQWLDDRTLEVTLRQGVTFHNGEVFDADIVSS